MTYHKQPIQWLIKKRASKSLIILLKAVFVCDLINELIPCPYSWICKTRNTLGSRRNGIYLILVHNKLRPLIKNKIK